MVDPIETTRWTYCSCARPIHRDSRRGRRSCIVAGRSTLPPHIGSNQRRRAQSSARSLAALVAAAAAGDVVGESATTTATATVAVAEAWRLGRH